jgi:O-antigen ligase
VSTSESALPRRGRQRLPAESLSRIRVRLPNLLEFGLWVLLVGTALALGAVSERASILLEAGCVLLFLLAFGWSRREPLPPAAGPLRILPALFVGWTLLQLVPLPPGLLRWISPGTHSLYARNLPGYAAPGGRADLETWLRDQEGEHSQGLESRGKYSTGFEGKIPIRPGWQPVSWYPGATLRWLFRFLAYWGVFLVVSRHLSEGACRVRLAWFLTLFGFALAVFGIVQRLTWNGKIYWTIPVYQGNPFGPWVNNNHFSGYLELILPIGIALGIRAYRTGRGRRHGSRSRIPRLLLILFLLIWMVAALGLARSRGGIFSLVLGGTILLFLRLVPKLRERWGRAAGYAVAAAPVVAALAGILWYAFQGGALRPDEPGGVEPSLAGRINAWRGVVGMILANPFTGTGLGTFGQAYPVFKTHGLLSVWQQAHNEYLQILSESGLPGFLILLAGLVWIARRHVVPLLRGRERADPVASGAAFAVMTLLGHSLVDFNLQIPANGLLFVVVAGMLIRLRTEEVPGLSGSPPDRESP